MLLPSRAADISLELKPGDTAHIIHASDGSLLTAHDAVEITGNPLFDSQYPWTEVQKIVVYNRYVPGAKPVVGLERVVTICPHPLARIGSRLFMVFI